MLLVFLDTETTGLDPHSHRAIEIAFKVVDTRSERTLVGYETLISQPLEVWDLGSAESQKIHGLTFEDLLLGKSEKVVASEIVNDLNRAGIGREEGVFVCQNPSFDRAFFLQLITAEMQKHLNWPYHWLDLASMFWMYRLLKTPEEAASLKESDLSKNQIANYFGVEKEGYPHRAMNGVDHLISCYQRLASSSLTSTA